MLKFVKKIYNSLLFWKDHVQTKFEESDFYKNVLTLLSGTVLAQAIPVLISPIISRIYTPKEFGSFTFFLTTASLLSILATGRFEQAIVLPKRDKNGFALFVLSILLNVFICVIIFIFILLFKDLIFSKIDNKILQRSIYLIPFTVLLMGVFQSINYWNNRKKTYKVIAIGKVVRTSTLIIGQLLLMFLSVLGLIISDFMSRVVSVLYMAIYTHPDWRQFKIVKADIVLMFKQYVDFLKYTMPNAFINNSSNNLPILFITNFYSSRETGLYSWSMRIIQMPMGMIISSVYQVFYQKISQAYNDRKKLKPIVLSTYRQLALIGVIPYFVIFIFAPDIFDFVFGAPWREAGLYTRYLIPWLFLIFLNSPLTSIILVLNKQKEYFVYEIILFVLRGGALFLSYFLFKDIEYLVIFYSVIGVIYNLFLMRFILIISNIVNEGSIYR